MSWMRLTSWLMLRGEILAQLLCWPWARSPMWLWPCSGTLTSRAAWCVESAPAALCTLNECLNGSHEPSRQG